MNLFKLDTLLDVTRATLNYVKSEPKVAAQLARYDINAAYLQTGEHLLQILAHHRVRLSALQDERRVLSQQINANLLTVHQQFDKHTRLASAAYPHDNVLSPDLTKNVVPGQQWKRVQQAMRFYRAFQKRNLTLRSLGVSDQDIRQSAATVDKLWNLKRERLRTKGASEKSLQHYQQAQGTLHRWLVRFRTVARTAFRNQPQWLEGMNLPVPIFAPGTPLSSEVTEPLASLAGA